ncbi:MAG: tetratricopeptide repeat protein [Terriglobia bacterium]
MLERAKPGVIAVALIAAIAATLGRAQDSRQPVTNDGATKAASLLSQGEAAYQKGDLGGAERLLEDFLRQSPRSARARALLGLTLAREGKTAAALINLQQACAIDPSNPDFAYDDAVLLLEAHRYASAIPILERLHRQSPDSDDVRVNLARAYAASGDFKKLSASISTLPPAAYNDEALLKALASVLAEAKQTAALERLWQAAIRRDPKQPLPYAALAKLWIARKQPVRAMTLLKSAPAEARGPLYLYALGETQQASGQYDEARGSFRQLVQMVPANAAAWQQLVRADLQANQIEQARADLVHARARFPNAELFQYQAAVVDYMLGRNTAGIGELTPLVKDGRPKDPRPVLLMAVLQSASGKYQDAARAFQRAEKLDPACNALTSYFYGATLLRMHRPQNAEVQLQAALRCQPHFALAQYRLGLALAQGGNPHGALAALKQAVRDDPTLADPYYAMAQIQRRMGETGAAQSSLARFNALHQRVAASDRDLFRDGAR